MSPRRAAAVFLTPAGVLLAAVTAFPIACVLWLSVQHRSLVHGAEGFAGLAGYARLAADQRFWNALGNTAYFTAVSVALELALGLAVALVLARTFRGRGPLRAAVLVPWVIPTVVAARTWEWLLHVEYGVVNHALGVQVNWLGDPMLAMHTAIAVDVWKTTPFVAVLLLAGLQGIPEDLHRAARVDGAGPWRRFTAVTLPALRPLIAVVLILRGIDAFRVFDTVYVLTGGGPGNATETLSIYAYKVLFRMMDIGYGSALAVVTFACVAAAAAACARLIGGRRP